MGDRSEQVGSSRDGTGPRPWVARLARLMDSAFRVPGTSIRFGLDPLIGLLPVVGDSATFVVGLLMLREAKRCGAPASVMGRMVLNLFVDWLVGLVPGVDLFLDTAVKAHTRNAELLERFVAERSGGESDGG